MINPPVFEVAPVPTNVGSFRGWCPKKIVLSIFYNKELKNKNKLNFFKIILHQLPA